MELTFQNFEHGMTYDHTDLGGYAGTQAVEGLQDYYVSLKKRKEAQKKNTGKPNKGGGSDGKSDPLSGLEEALFGLMSGIKKGAEWVSDTYDTIAGGVSDFMSPVLDPISNAFDSIVDGVSDFAGNVLGSITGPSPDAEPTPAQVRMNKKAAEMLVFSKARNEAKEKNKNLTDAEAAVIGRKEQIKFRNANANNDLVEMDLTEYSAQDKQLAMDSLVFKAKNPGHDWRKDEKWNPQPVQNTQVSQADFMQKFREQEQTSFDHERNRQKELQLAQQRHLANLRANGFTDNSGLDKAKSAIDGANFGLGVINNTIPVSMKHGIQAAYMRANQGAVLSETALNSRYLSALGNDAKFLTGLKVIGYAGFMTSSCIAGIQTYDYYKAGGSDPLVYSKTALDTAMSFVGLAGPVGFAVSATYHIVNLSTDGFDGWADAMKRNYSDKEIREEARRIYNGDCD